MIKRYAAVYIRVSTTDQGERYSPGSQKAKLLAKAAADGYSVRPEHIFEDHHTGKQTSRPQFDKLRVLVKSGAVQCVIVLCVDRLARKVHDAAMIAAEFKRHNCTLDFVEMKNDDSPEGRLQFNILASMAEYIGEKIVERGMDGRQRMVDDGLVPGGPPVYGHDCDPNRKGKRVLNEFEAKISDEMYRMALGEDSCYGIAAKMNGRGIRSKGMNGEPPALWSRTTVYQLLTNRQYIGEYPHKSGKILEVPRIVSDELFFAVQAKLEAIGKRWVGRRSKRCLLTNFLYCRRCGHRCHGTGKRKYLAYRCGYTNGSKPPVKRLCAEPQILAWKLEQLAWEMIWALLKDPRHLLSQARAYFDSLPKPEPDENASAMEQELIHARRKRDNRLRMYRLGDEEYDDVAKAEMLEIKRRIAFLEHELSAVSPVLELPEENLVEAHLREITEGDEPATLERRRNILEGLEELRMVYGDGRLTITGKVPIGSRAASSTSDAPNCYRSVGADNNYTHSIPFILERRVA
jgi:site-specific DNA recombinase